MCVTPGKAAGICLLAASSPVACRRTVPGCGRILGHWGKGVRVVRGEVVRLGSGWEKCKGALRGVQVPVGWVRAHAMSEISIAQGGVC